MHCMFTARVLALYLEWSYGSYQRERYHVNITTEKVIVGRQERLEFRSFWIFILLVCPLDRDGGSRMTAGSFAAQCYIK